MQEHNEQEIDLMELIAILISRWYMIAGAIIAVVTVTAIYAYGTLDDVYEASSSVLVDVRTDEQFTTGDLALAQRLLDTYTDVAQSNTAINRLIDEAGLDYTTGQVRNMMSIEKGRGDSILIRFTFTSTDSEEAAMMANTMVTIMQELAEQNDSLYDIELLDEAQAPLFPTGPNRALYLIIGLVLGGMIGVFGVFALEFFNRTVKSSKDIEGVLKLRTLGTIPEYDLSSEVEE